MAIPFVRHTLYLVLQGEWPKLSPATKTHLSVTLQRCANLLSNHNAAPRCKTLIGLVNDPWGHPILHRILNGASDVDDSEGLYNMLLFSIIPNIVNMYALYSLKCIKYIFNYLRGILLVGIWRRFS